MYVLLHQYRSGGYRLGKPELLKKAAQEIVDMNHTGLVWLVHLEYDQKHFDILSERPIGKEEAADWFADSDPDEINGKSELIPSFQMQRVLAGELARRQAFLFAEEDEEEAASALAEEIILDGFEMLANWTKARNQAEAESGDYVLVSQIA